MAQPWKSLTGAALGLLAGACAVDRSPVVVAVKFAPPDGAKWTYAPKRGEAALTPCRIAIAEVRDTRIDSEILGNIGARIVKSEDTAGWIRSGLDSLSADTRLAMVDPAAGNPHLSIKAELSKAYIQSLQTINTANIVVRIVYSLGGADIDEKSFRGEERGVNMNSGDEEAYYVLNRALQYVILAIDQDLVARCEAAKIAPAPAAGAAAQ